MNIEQIPSEVQEVWVWKTIGMCGSETMGRINTIIDKYPEYFPWEHTYKSIPQDVHDSYYEERFGGIVSNGKGLWERLNEKPKKSKKNKEISLTEAIAEMFKSQERQKRREKREYNKKKKLWDKYYKQFGLEYRGN